MPRNDGLLENCQNIFEVIGNVREMLPYLEMLAECLGNLPQNQYRAQIATVARRLYDDRAGRQRFYNLANYVVEQYGKASTAALEEEQGEGVAIGGDQTGVD